MSLKYESSSELLHISRRSFCGAHPPPLRVQGSEVQALGWLRNPHPSTLVQHFCSSLFRLRVWVLGFIGWGVWFLPSPRWFPHPLFFFFATESVSGRRGNNLKRFEDFHLKAKARIWTSVSHVCHIRSTGYRGRERMPHALGTIQVWLGKRLLYYHDFESYTRRDREKVDSIEAVE